MDALVRRQSGTLSKVVNVGDALGPGFATALGESLIFLDSTVFQASLSGGGSGIYIKSPGGIEKILAAGDPHPLNLAKFRWHERIGFPHVTQ